MLKVYRRDWDGWISPGEGRYRAPLITVLMSDGGGNLVKTKIIMFNSIISYNKRRECNLLMF